MDASAREPICSALAFPDDVRSTAIRDRVIDLVCEDRCQATPGSPLSLPRRLRPGTQVENGKRIHLLSMNAI
jgi:hypothetical protein